MKVGCFYFIKDSYFTDYLSADGKRNKKASPQGQPHNRPYFCAVVDGDIGWMSPVSSQVQKYKNLYKKKTSNGKPCDTIDFAYVKGNENAVLIQDMMPVTNAYINNQYFLPDGITPIELSEKAKKIIVGKARKVMRLAASGKVLTLTPIVDLEQKLRSNNK